MATRKITITLPEEQVKKIRKAVAAGKSPSVSSFVKHSVDSAFLDEELFDRKLNDILMETGGPITPKEEAWLTAMATSGGRRKPSRKRRAA